MSHSSFRQKALLGRQTFGSRNLYSNIMATNGDIKADSDVLSSTWPAPRDNNYQLET